MTDIGKRIGRIYYSISRHVKIPCSSKSTGQWISGDRSEKDAFGRSWKEKNPEEEMSVSSGNAMSDSNGALHLHTEKKKA